jgi:hypothetical protein
MGKIRYNADGYLNEFHKKSTEASFKAVESYKTEKFSLEDFKKQVEMLKNPKKKLNWEYLRNIVKMQHELKEMDYFFKLLLHPLKFEKETIYWEDYDKESLTRFSVIQKALIEAIGIENFSNWIKKQRKLIK